MKLRISLQGCGGIDATVQRASELVVEATKVPGASADMELVKDRIMASLRGYASVKDIDLTRSGVVSCWLDYSETEPVVVHYLEIEPQVLWIYPGMEVSNRVISNTEWIIN